MTSGSAMPAPRAEHSAAGHIWVRRQWSDYRLAKYRVDDIEGLHWTDTSGGIGTRAPRDFLHGYVWCDRMVEGELAHSCAHGPGPHRIKVCIVKKGNDPVAFAALVEKAAAGAHRNCDV